MTSKSPSHFREMLKGSATALSRWASLYGLEKLVDNLNWETLSDKLDWEMLVGILVSIGDVVVKLLQ